VAWVYSEKLKAETGNGWSDEPEPETSALAVATSADILAAGGIQRASEVVELAAAAGLDLAAAAVVLLKESGGGFNVFGHDKVPTGGAYIPGSPVTQQSYESYHAAVLAGKAGRQGIGPLQLTFWALQDEADTAGGCWLWEANVQVGFKTLAGLIKANGLYDGFMRFNGSGPAAQAYANDAMGKYAVWATRLGVEPGGGGEDDMTPEENQALADVWHQLNDEWPPWPGGISDAQGSAYNLARYVLRANVQLNQLPGVIQKMLAQQSAQVRRLPQTDLDNIAATFQAVLAEGNEDIGTVSFWQGAGERVVRAFAVSMLSLLSAGVVDITHLAWQTDLSISGGAALVSLLTSLVASQVGTKGTSSFLKGNS
jgi:hypothetical protein